MMASMVLLLNCRIHGRILRPGREASRVIDSFFWRKLLIRSGLARLIPSVRRQLRGADDAIAWYSDRTLAVPIAELEDFALLPSIHTPNSIDFALGSPPCDISVNVGRSMNDRRAVSPWGLHELRSDLAAEFQLNHGVEHDPNDEMLITHGASGAFASCLDAFINPGDAAVLFDPTSPIFSIGLKHRRARVRWVPTWSDDGQLRFAMDRFAQAMRGAKLLVLADPSNPTGCVLAPEDVEQIAFWARKHDVLIFQDASFDRWRSQPARTRLASLPNAKNRILTCGSFSKSHGLTSARVGWLTGNRHLVRPCAAAMLLTAPFVPALCQQVAIQALRTSESVREDFTSRRAHVSERLQEMGLKPWPAVAGFFLWVPVPNDENGRDFAQRLLRETGVLVNPGSPFGPSGERFFRLSFATDAGRLREGLERLERFLANEKVRGLPVAEHVA